MLPQWNRFKLSSFLVFTGRFHEEEKIYFSPLHLRCEVYSFLYKFKALYNRLISDSVVISFIYNICAINDFGLKQTLTYNTCIWIALNIAFKGVKNLHVWKKWNELKWYSSVYFGKINELEAENISKTASFHDRAEVDLKWTFFSTTSPCVAIRNVPYTKEENKKKPVFSLFLIVSFCKRSNSIWYSHASQFRVENRKKSSMKNML